jgi:hypothetical protein
MAKLTVGYAADGTAKTYTTLAAAYAAASTGDELEFWYSNASMNPVWNEVFNASYVTKAVSVTGALPGRKVSFVNTGFWYCLNGDLSGISAQLTIKNISVTALGYLGYGFMYADSSGTGNGYIVEDCTFIGLDYAVSMQGGKSSVFVLRNCLFVACSYAFYCVTPIVSVVGNTFFKCGNGVYGLNAWSGSILKNNLALSCKVPYADNYAWAYWVASHNVSDNSTYPAPGTSGQLVSRATAKLLADELGGFDVDGRVASDSPMIGAGVAHADMSSTDIDGKTRGSPPAIGCSEGATAYTDPGEATVLETHTYLFAGQTRTGTLAAGGGTAPTAEEVAAAVWDAATADHDTAATFGAGVEAIRAKTDNLPASPANEETVAALPTIAEILATEVDTGFTVQDALATIGYLDTSAGNAAALLAAQIGDGTITVAQILRVLAAAAAGKTSGHPGAPVFRNLADTQDVIAGALDANGNRTEVTVTP